MIYRQQIKQLVYIPPCTIVLAVRDANLSSEGWYYSIVFLLTPHVSFMTCYSLSVLVQAHRTSKRKSPPILRPPRTDCGFTSHQSSNGVTCPLLALKLVSRCFIWRWLSREAGSSAFRLHGQASSHKMSPLYRCSVCMEISLLILLPHI